MSVQRRQYAPEAFLRALRAVGEHRVDDYLVATTGDVADWVGCSRTTARRHLTRLADGETLAEPYSGYWYLARFGDDRHLLAHGTGT
jgi:response regulator of citrate/malate metabolism